MKTATKNKQATEWTDEQYDKQRKDIEAGFELRKECADAWRDRRVSVLFADCGWTQERIAEKEDKSQAWVKCRLRFSRFLRFISTECTNGVLIPRNLTEGRFRAAWEQTPTGQNEAARFKYVVEILNADLTLVKPPERVHAKIVEMFGDWKWHTTEEIVERTGFRRESVNDCLARMASGVIRKDVECKRQQAGSTLQWRLRETKQKKLKSNSQEILIGFQQAKDHLDRIDTLTLRGPTVTCNSSVRQEVEYIRLILHELIHGRSAQRSK